MFSNNDIIEKNDAIHGNLGHNILIGGVGNDYV